MKNNYLLLLAPQLASKICRQFGNCSLLLATLGLLSFSVSGQTKDKAAVPKKPAYRLAMSAAFVSQEGISAFRQLAQWLSKKSGTHIEFIDGLGYEAINKMLESGAVDMGFVCGYPYVLLKDRPHPTIELLVAPIPSAPRYNGKAKYYSDLIVQKDSPYRRLEDLRGKTFVYNEEMSNSGYNMARYRLGTQGKAKGFFGTVMRSGAHEDSIHMVASGKADASYVDSLVLDYERATGVSDASRVRVIESVGPAGIVPAVISLRVPPQEREKLRKILTQMNQDEEGRAILKQLCIVRFDLVADSNYDDIRKMLKAAEKGNFTKIEAGGASRK